MSSTRADLDQSTILFAETISDTPRRVSTAEIMRRTGMTSWTEVPLFRTTEPFPEQIPPEAILTKVQYKALKKESLTLSSKLKLCNTKSTGYTVIANEALLEGTRIIYAGNVVNYPAQDATAKMRGNWYSTTLSESMLDSDNIKFGTHLYFLDAKDCGNISRFIQHAEPQSRLAEAYVFNSPKKINQVAAENIVFSRYFYNKTPLAVMRVSKPVKKNELLVSDYGLSYWDKLGVIPELFYKDGTIVSPTAYTFNIAPVIEITLNYSEDGILFNFSLTVTKRELQEALTKENFQIGNYYQGTQYIASVPCQKLQHQLYLFPNTNSIELKAAKVRMATISQAMQALSINTNEPAESKTMGLNPSSTLKR